MIETGWLMLRLWREEDVAPFAEMNRNVEVMERHGWFLHPALPDGHRLKPHVVYRLDL